MKKVLIAMCAMAAVMACTKTEATFEQPAEISFSPVSRYDTKAAISGQTYSETQNFYAWAYTHETSPVAYFSEILFKPETDQPDNVPTGLTSYVGDPSQYWPNEKKLNFAGVTVSGNVAQGTIEGTATTITVTGYDQPLPNDNTRANDLMWFFDNTGYGKGTSYVQPTMKHACSWIVIDVALDSKLSSYWTNVVVNSINFETLNTVGTATMTSNGVAWSSVGTPETNVEIYAGSSNNDISTTAKTFATVANNTIVIPQTPTTLAVNISYTTPANGRVTETISGVKLDYDGVNDTNTAWEAGKKYTYTLTVGADEIKIAPKSTDWDPSPTSGSHTQTIK